MDNLSPISTSTQLSCDQYFNIIMENAIRIPAVSVYSDAETEKNQSQFKVALSEYKI
ncbi:MAG: hypothetical protein HAW62_00450 [Endozoicomonadaceae bacterium]|nr:hypothetical protein [Endozoicomonadaceae bacterium]